MDKHIVSLGGTSGGRIKFFAGATKWPPEFTAYRIVEHSRMFVLGKDQARTAGLSG